ncbi:MAG: hypothetical protein U0797_14565 [Gemmataceae bacterium]
MGILGTGQGGKLNNWSFRDDFSFQLVWQVESLGFGNAALVSGNGPSGHQAIVGAVPPAGRGRRGDHAGPGRPAIGRGPRHPGRRSLREAMVTFNKSLEGLSQTERFDNVLHEINRPQEVANALMQLKVAFDEYFNTVAEYNVAQFDLFHAAGLPRPGAFDLLGPGEVLPWTRHGRGYLPPVGAGPPQPPGNEEPAPCNASPEGGLSSQPRLLPAARTRPLAGAQAPSPRQPPGREGRKGKAYASRR